MVNMVEMMIDILSLESDIVDVVVDMPPPLDT